MYILIKANEALPGYVYLTDQSSLMANSKKKKKNTCSYTSIRVSLVSTLNHVFRASRAACVRLRTERLSVSPRLVQRVTSSSSARQGGLGTRLAPGVSVQSRLSGFETDGILEFGRRLCGVFKTVCDLFEYLSVFFSCLFCGFLFYYY